MPDDGLK